MVVINIPRPTVDVTPFDGKARMTALRKMLEIRLTEEKIQEMFLANLVRGTTHLCIGQEAVSTGVAALLRKGDTVTCTYRGHGHALALGMSVRAMIAEMMGRASGCCHGKGGSMHMTDASIGLLGANAIVGAQLPIACGAALTAKIKKTGAISVTFFGDAATNIGAFHEALNLASVWKLPVVFVCENNRYGEYSPQAWTTPVENLSVRAASYNMPGVTVDGQDVETVHAEFRAAAERARAGEGPTLLE
jgi:pyruvate dehydrogenase E1 component alpha subunit